jgi:hypothetical protein
MRLSGETAMIRLLSRSAINRYPGKGELGESAGRPRRRRALESGEPRLAWLDGAAEEPRAAVAGI